MKISTEIPESLVRPLKSIFAHYTVISIVLAILTLIYCVYTVQNAMRIPPDESYRQTQQQKNTRTSFDAKTIEMVEQLRTREDTDIVTLPSGRINPFAE